MASKAQMDALLAVGCRWCGVGAGERCKVRIGSRWVTVPSTLDGESHDLRWQDALGMSARVLSAEVARHVGWTEVPAPEQEEVAMPGKVAVLERPW
jgi:hypothetical protein